MTTFSSNQGHRLWAFCLYNLVPINRDLPCQPQAEEIFREGLWLAQGFGELWLDQPVSHDQLTASEIESLLAEESSESKPTGRDGCFHLCQLYVVKGSSILDNKTYK